MYGKFVVLICEFNQRNCNSFSSAVVGRARLDLPLRQRNDINTNVANNQRNANARRRGFLLGYAAGTGLLNYLIL